MGSMLARGLAAVVLTVDAILNNHLNQAITLSS